MSSDPSPSRAPIPGWVKVFFAVLALLVAAFVGLHLSGHGFSHHMHGG
ncbi:MAG: hypothetical protein JSR98_04685 [Proteobacteria bacterium]|nr:hypothetical protein [Pseudomonadota bacterium]